MEASAPKAPTVEAAEAGLSAEGISSRKPSAIKAAEGAGTHALGRGSPARAPAAKIRAMASQNWSPRSCVSAATSSANTPARAASPAKEASAT